MMPGETFQVTQDLVDFIIRIHTDEQVRYDLQNGPKEDLTKCSWESCVGFAVAVAVLFK